jgi:DNA-binding NarL/FixJ family response regulator
LTSVLLADDQALVRGGFRLILDAQEDLEVVGEADDGRAAIEAARSLRPDIVLMDVRMPELDGIAATRVIVSEQLASHVLVLTTFDEDRVVWDAMAAGASGFLLKTAPPVQLVDAVRTVAAGEALLAPTVTRRLIEEFVRRPPPGDQSPERLAALTDREREVMALVAAGLSNEEIAAKLFVSPATAKTHVSRAMIKLGARDRAQLVVLAYEAGLVRPGWLG